jgi:hypothetical protein
LEEELFETIFIQGTLPDKILKIGLMSNARRKFKMARKRITSNKRAIKARKSRDSLR